MIITDSGCDLTKETIAELGITVLPFEITIGGKSYKEIADAMEISEDQVKVNLFRARQFVKSHISHDK